MATAIPHNLVPAPQNGGNAYADVLELMDIVDEMPLPTDEQHKHGKLITRFACSLDEMREEFPGEPSLEDALGWKDRSDFEQLLDAWEGGRHPAQQARR